MEMFESGVRAAKKRETKRIFKTPTLADAPAKLVNNGLTIEWAHGNRPNEITTYEIERLKVCCGWKRVQTFKALHIKGLMRTMGRNQIIKHLNGKKGYSPSTIANIYRALSQ